jgi:hypothetical protein
MFQDLDHVAHCFHIMDYQETSLFFGSLKIGSEVSPSRIATFFAPFHDF